jgi:O-antigen/teichoic acid export membrane protein
VLKNVALYTLAFKIASLVRFIVVESIKMAIAPLLLKKMEDPDNGRFFSKVMLYTSFGVMFCIVGISLFAQELIKLISNSREYWDAIALTPILAMALFFVNLKEISIYGLVFTKKTRIISLLTIIAGAVNLLLNILLIPNFGTFGAAAATLLAQLLFWGLIYITAQRYYPLPYDMKRILLIFLVGTLLTASFYFLRDVSVGPRILIKSGLLISYPFLFLPFNFYEEVEKETILRIARKWIRIRDLKMNIRELTGSGNISSKEE